MTTCASCPNALPADSRAVTCSPRCRARRFRRLDALQAADTGRALLALLVAALDDEADTGTVAALVIHARAYLSA